MLHSVFSSNRSFALLIIVTAFMLWTTDAHCMSTTSKNDPFPVFTIKVGPQEYLLNGYRLHARQNGWDGPLREKLSFTVSPFSQMADTGRNNRKESAPLGDLQGNPTGRTNMIALLLGQTPAGQTLPPTLLTAQQQLFPGQTPPILNSIAAEDPLFNFGFYSFELNYKKRGVRFDVLANIFCDFGVRLQTGVADICQTVTKVVDYTCDTVFDCSFQNVLPPYPDGTDTSTDPNTAIQVVEQFLMKQLKPIAREIGIDLSSFHAVSIEDVRFSLFWAHVYNMNYNKGGWPLFQLIPFTEFLGSISPGKVTDPCKRFAAPFGNNGHSALAAKAGLCFNFIDTIEIGAEVGYSHFFPRNVNCFHVPNQECQSGMFPFATTVHYQPGHNWHYAGHLSAYHFYSRMSFYFQYVLVDHGPDHIRIKPCDDAFLPEVLERVTTFKVKVANVAFNYDITPNMALGLLWQAPLSQQNAYRSTTLMLGFNVII